MTGFITGGYINGAKFVGRIIESDGIMEFRLEIALRRLHYRLCNG